MWPVTPTTAPVPAPSLASGQRGSNKIAISRITLLLRKLPLKNTASMEQMWIILGLAFYISYCNDTAQATAFVERLSRRYKDGRRDLSWLNRAKCAELCGHVEVLFAPIREQV